MYFELNIILQCLIFFKDIQESPAYSKKDKVKYNKSKYFFNSHYLCFDSHIYPLETKFHLRRCKISYSSVDLSSPKCSFCPLQCSWCGYILKYYTFALGKEEFYDGESQNAKCIFHSLDRIEPHKIRARKGKTVKEDVKCKIKDFCGKSPCQNKATCAKLYHWYVCICPKEYYGKHCTEKTPAANVGKLSHGVQLWFPLEVTAGKLFPFLVVVAYEGEGQVIELETATGYTIRLKPSDKIKKFPGGCPKDKCRCNSNQACKSAYSGNLVADQYYLKNNFLTLPMMALREHLLSFTSQLTIRVYNEKFGTKPVYEEKMQAHTRLRDQTIFPKEINPGCVCQVHATSDATKGAFHRGLTGDCKTKYSEKITIDQSHSATISFVPRYVTYGWQVFLGEGDKGIVVEGKEMKETGMYYIRKPIEVTECGHNSLVETYFWRIYKMDGLHKLTVKKEKDKSFETKKIKCSQSKSLQTKCEVKVQSDVDAGDYMLRVTLRSSKVIEGKKDKPIYNYDVNYYCYFNVKSVIKTLSITGDAKIRKCLVNIDTEGYDKEGDLIWTCVASKGTCPPEVDLNKNKPSLSNVKFKDGEYKICVEWTANGKKVGKPCVDVIAEQCEKPKPPEPDYVIDCREGCDGAKVDPDVPPRYAVEDRNNVKNADKVTWEVTDGQGNMVDLTDVRITDGVRDNELKIDIKKLNPNEVYTIVAKVKVGDKEISTPPRTLTYSEAHVPTNGTCTVEPMEGMKGVTLFDIECFGWQTEGPIIYEFFDKGPEDVDHYRGRMIGYSLSGILRQFRLSRGRVTIYLVNEDGGGPEVNITVQLTDFDNNMSHIDNLMEEMAVYSDYEIYQPAMATMSVVAEIFYEDMENSDIHIRKILSTLEQIQHTSAESMKLGISTILSVLVHGTLEGTFLLDDVEELCTGKILLNLANLYLKYATKPGHKPRLKVEHINQLSRNLMESVDMAIIAQDRNVTKLRPEEDIDYDVLDNLNMASNDLAETTMIATYLVGRVRSYGGGPQQITSDANVTDTWVWVNEAKGLVDVATEDMTSYFNITEAVAKTFDPTHDIMLQFSLMKRNMFWWSKDNINTEVLMVGLAEKMYRPGYFYVPHVPAPVQIFMKVKKLEKTTVAGTVTQLDPKLDTDTLDRRIVVHRFVLPPLGKLFIKFKFGNTADQSESETADISKRNVRAAKTNTTTKTTKTTNPTTTTITTTAAAATAAATTEEPPAEEPPTEEPPAEDSPNEEPSEGATGTPASSLRVLIYFNMRPDWQAMANATDVNAEDPSPPMPYDVIEREHFYYMAILPDKDVPVSESVTYSFEVYYINCHIWKNQWVNHYCLVGPGTTEETVECQCTHLSIFSSSIFFPPNDLNPVLDLPLFLTITDNWYVAVLVVIILLLFLLLLIWACLKDRKDALCGNVIVLHDNYPGDRYPYLIAIFTGSRLTAGTSAVVGLRLYGDVYMSRPTILKADNRKVLQRDQDDWFLLTYPVSLGMINAVQMWHNNQGRRPDWFVSKVIVYDLEAKTQYLFIMEQWLAMEVDEFPEAIVRPATSDEVMSMRRIFIDNSMLGLRENHFHLGVFTRHPRSPLSRKQRLTVLMTLIMSAMLASIMFYKAYDEFDTNVDEYRINFGWRELVISIQAFIISTVIALIALFLFRKGYKQKKEHQHHRSTLFMPRKRREETDEYWMSRKPVYVDLSTFIAFDMEKAPKRRKDMSCAEKIGACVKKCSRQKAFHPVHLATEQSSIETKKAVLAIAWLFSLGVIIICALLVVMFSLKFGKVKSLKWLSSLVVTELQDIFLFTPLKIIIVAVLLSVAFERSGEVAAFKVDIKTAIKRDLVGNKKYLNELVEKRKSSIYYPMTELEKVKKRKKTMRKMKWRLICDFFAIGTYILVLCYIMKIMWSGTAYFPNAHAKDILMTKYHGRFTALQDVYNRTQFFSYLENTFVRSMFTFRWFDDLNFEILSPPGATNRKDWAKDYVSKMLGAPRMRQLRVRPSSCTLRQMKVMMKSECNPPWRDRYSDTATYSVSWSKVEDSDEQTYTWGYRTYWSFTVPKNTSVFPLSGKSGTTYPSGGYIMPLAVKRAESKSYVIQVEEEHWIDERTRAVFLELTLFNANTHLYSQVTAIVEHMTSGLYLTTANVDSVHTTANWDAINIVYIVFIVALLIRIVYKLNRNGLFIFVKKRLNDYEVLVVIISILSIVYYLIHIKVSSFYVEDFYRVGEDKFFNFKDMIKYFRYTKVLLGLLFCMLMFRLFVSWYFGPSYIGFYHTIFISRRWIITMMVVLLFYFLIIWRFIGYTIDARIFYNYRVNVLHYKMYSAIFRRDFKMRTKIIAFVLCLLALFFRTVFFIFFTHYYRVGKRIKLTPMQHFNFVTFFIDEIKKPFGKKKEKPTVPLSDRQVHLARDMKVPRR